MTNTKERAEGTFPLDYQCRLPLSTRTVNHLADLLRRHLKAIGSRWRILPPGEIAVIVLAVCAMTSGWPTWPAATRRI